METLDIILRSSAVTGILIYLILAIRDGRKSIAVRYSMLACTALLAVFISDRSQPIWFYAPVRLIDMFSIPLIWWSALALLYTDFRPRALHWAGLGLYILAILPWRLWIIGWTDFPEVYPFWVIDMLTFLLFGHLGWVTLAGFRNDLVDRRRRMRIIMLTIIIVATLASTTGETFLEAAGNDNLVLAYTAFITTLSIGAVILWSSRLHPEVFQFAPTIAPQSDTNIDPRDIAAHARLVDIMETERAYTEHGLTIGELAAKVGIPEHQLRALINQSMGYRNFASFLNGYRIEAAKSVLSDPAEARLPVLTVAMDAGFGSLAPFNRAFKAAQGITPSEYRAQKLADQN